MSCLSSNPVFSSFASFDPAELTDLEKFFEENGYDLSDSPKDLIDEITNDLYDGYEIDLYLIKRFFEIYPHMIKEIEKRPNFLYAACETDNLELAKFLFSPEIGFNFDCVKKTILHSVCQTSNDSEMIEFLIERGADVNSKIRQDDGDNFFNFKNYEVGDIEITPLFVALMERNKESAKVLLKHGANIGDLNNLCGNEKAIKLLNKIVNKTE